MNFSTPLRAGVLVRRYKRFLADVRLPSGEVVTIHCPNTGSMMNCAEPGWKVWFSLSDNPKRKYPGTWELVQNSAGDYIGVNTGRANHLVKEAIDQGRIKELRGYRSIKSEVRYGKQNSRIDLFLSDHPRRSDACYVEIKSVTLLSSPSGDDDEANDNKANDSGADNTKIDNKECADKKKAKGIGLFPDAVTTRGLKHLEELLEVKREGERAVLFYCVQHRGIREVRPAIEIDPAYSRMLETINSQGVEILAYGAAISPHGITLSERLPVSMGKTQTKTKAKSKTQGRKA